MKTTTSEDGDRIVYVLISNGGGVDGMDRSDKGGAIMDASFNEEEVKKNPNLPWGTIKKRVYNMKEAKTKAMRKLNKVDKLVLGL